MSARTALHRLLAQPRVNALARGVLRPLAPIIPPALLHRVPLVGTADVALPGGRRMRLTSDGRDNLAAMLYWSGWRSFEPETLDVYLALLPEARVVFDVGAYVGIFAMAAALGASERDVHAFEPVPESFARLQENLRANRLANVRAVPAAVGDTDGETTLFVPDGVWLPSHSSTRADFRAHTRPLAVAALTLERYARERGIERVDLMKIDTEGNEDEVLAGAGELFERSRPFVFCEVLRGLTEDRLNAWFEGRRYRFYRLEAQGLRRFGRIEGDETYRARNFLFAPEERAERALVRLPEPARGRSIR
jgi:FkbM family methyltransferase